MKQKRWMIFWIVLFIITMTLSGCGRIAGKLAGELLEPVARETAERAAQEAAERLAREAAEQVADGLAKQAAGAGKRTVQEWIDLASQSTARSQASKMVAEAVKKAPTGVSRAKAAVAKTATLAPIGELSTQLEARIIPLLGRDLDLVGNITKMIDEGLTPGAIVRQIWDQENISVVISRLAPEDFVVIIEGNAFRQTAGYARPIPSPVFLELSPQQRLMKVADQWYQVTNGAATPVSDLAKLIPPGRLETEYLTIPLAAQDDFTVFFTHKSRIPSTDSLYKINYDVNGTTVEALLDPATGTHYLSAQSFPTGLPGDIDGIVKQIGDSYHDFHQHLKGEDYRKLAQDLIDLKDTSKLLLELNLERGLHEVDVLIKEGQYTAVLDELGRLTDLYGARPEIVLREGMVRIKQGEVERLVSTLNQSTFRQLTNPDAYFDEVNARLADNTFTTPVERANFYRAAQITDLNDYHARQGLTGKVTAAAEDEHLVIHYGLGESWDQQGKTIDDLIFEPNALYYTEDAPGIYNLHFDVSTEASLHQLLEGELPKIIQLQRGEIANLRPTTLYTGAYEEALPKIQQSHISSSYQSGLKTSLERESGKLVGL